MQALSRHFSIYPQSAGYQLARDLMNVHAQTGPPGAPVIETQLPTGLRRVALQCNPQTSIPYTSFHQPGMIEGQYLANIIREIPDMDRLEELSPMQAPLFRAPQHRRYMESNAARIANLASRFIAMGTSARLTDLYPELSHEPAQERTLHAYHLQWALRDMSRIFQLMAMPQTANPGIPDALQFEDYLRQTQSAVPINVLRTTSTGGASNVWDERELCSHWRRYLYGTDNPTYHIGHQTATNAGQAGSLVYNPDIVQDYEDMPQWLPVDAATIDIALTRTPRVEPGFVYSVAMNNIQAQAWYLRIMALQLMKFYNLENHQLHFGVTLGLLIERHEDADMLALPGHNGYKQSYTNVRITELTSDSNCADIARMIINAINTACYQYQEQYQDESDTMAIIRSVSIVPISNNVPTNNSALPNSLRVMPTRLTPRHLPPHLQSADIGDNPFQAMRPNIQQPMTSAEIAGHARAFMRYWISNMQVHARPPSLPIQLRAMMDVYALDIPETAHFRHQCFAHVLLVYATLREHLHGHDTEEAWEAQSFYPSAYEMARMERANRKGSGTIKHDERIQTVLRAVEDHIQHWDDPNITLEEFQSVYTQGNMAQSLKMYFRHIPSARELYVLMLSGSASHLKTMMLHIQKLENGNDFSVDEVTTYPSQEEYVICILSGHAFMMNKASAQVFMKEIILPCYGAKTLLEYHNRRQFTAETKYKLAIPEAIQLTWDEHQMKRALRNYEGIKLEKPTKAGEMEEELFVLAYDCETGTCDKCAPGTTHPVMVCLGINLTKILTFEGVQCPMRQADGCFTKMVFYLRDLSILPSRRYILAAHYGSKFDHQFLLQTLLEMSVPVDVIKAQSKLQKISFWNISTVDTANIYIGSLEHVSETAMKDRKVQALLPANYITAGKYNAFPYGALDMKYEMRNQSYEELSEQEELWGGKRTSAYPELTPSQANSRYIWETFPECICSTTGTLNVQMLTRKYCEEDVRLLFALIVMHYCVAIRNPMNGKVVDLTGCITASSMAWKVFRGCFLTIDLPGRNRTEMAKLGIRVKEPRQPHILDMTEADMVDHMIQGGLTTSNVRLIRSRTAMLCIDINSSYPARMQEDLPYEYTHKTTFQGDGMPLHEILASGLAQVTDWFLLSWADFRDAEFEERPYTVKFNGYNIGVSWLPMWWMNSNGKIQWHVRYGGELAVYLKHQPPGKCFFMVKMAMHYKAAPIFRQFATELYNNRLEAKARKDVQLDAFIKLNLNGAFGKTCERRKPKMEIAMTEEQLAGLAEMKGAITSIQLYKMQVKNADNLSEPIQRDVIILETTKDDLGPGEHAVIGSSILALARAELAKVLLELELTFHDDRGQRLRSPQGDTDSILIQEPTLATPAEQELWNAFQRKYFDAKRLGAWKIEARVQGVFYGAGKKNYCLAEVDLETGEERIEKMACKGAPKKIVEKKGTAHFKDMVYGGTRTIEIPTSFKSDGCGQMIKTQIHRNLRAGNHTRIFSEDPEEWSKTYDTLNDFLEVCMRRIGKTSADLPRWRIPLLPGELTTQMLDDMSITFV